MPSVDNVSGLNIINVNAGLDPSWYVQHVVVWDPQTDHMFFFLLEDWLSVENQKNGTVEKEVPASCKRIELPSVTKYIHVKLLDILAERNPLDFSLK